MWRSDAAPLQMQDKPKSTVRSDGGPEGKRKAAGHALEGEARAKPKKKPQGSKVALRYRDSTRQRRRALKEVWTVKLGRQTARICEP